MDKKNNNSIWVYIFFILLGAFASYVNITHAKDNIVLIISWVIFVPFTVLWIILLLKYLFKKESRNSDVSPATKSKQAEVSHFDEDVKVQDDEQESTNGTSSATEIPEQNDCIAESRNESNEPYTPYINDILDLCTMTGARFADARKALTEAKGDFKKAKSLLPSPKSYTKKETAKKQPRTTTISELERIYENHQDNIGKHRIVDGMLYKVTDVETVWGDGEDHGLHLSLECISEDWLPYEYEIKDGEITIIKGYGPILDGELVIPATIEGCLVTRIQRFAFGERKDLKSIKIPDTVKYIEEHALGDCEELVYIESYESGKLAGTQAQSNDLYIEEYAFAGCKSLKDIGILDRVTHIDLSAVWGTNWLNNQPGGIIYVNNVLLGFHGKDSQCDAIVRVKEGTTIIAKEAFNGCTSLQHIIIPDSVIRIEASAFQNCSSLSEITIPDSVICIEASTFQNCSSLSEITIPDSVIRIEASAFQNCSSLNEITIPDSVAYLGELTWRDGSVFEECTSLKSIKLPESLKELGRSTFKGCTALKEIVMPPNVTTIGDECFMGCTALEEIVIPPNVTTIGNECFMDCTALEEIVIPPSVTTIGDECFMYCTALEKIVIPPSVTTMGEDCFIGTPWYDNPPDEEGMEADNNTFKEQESSNNEEMPEDVTETEDYANETTLVLPTVDNDDEDVKNLWPLFEEKELRAMGWEFVFCKDQWEEVNLLLKSGKYDEAEKKTLEFKEVYMSSLIEFDLLLLEAQHRKGDFNACSETYEKTNRTSLAFFSAINKTPLVLEYCEAMLDLQGTIPAWIQMAWKGAHECLNKVMRSNPPERAYLICIRAFKAAIAIEKPLFGGNEEALIKDYINSGLSRYPKSKTLLKMKSETEQK